MLLLQYLILALSLALIIRWATALKRKPWVWSLLLLALVILAENLLRSVIPTPVATLAGSVCAFGIFYLARFTSIRF